MPHSILACQKGSARPSKGREVFRLPSVEDCFSCRLENGLEEGKTGGKGTSLAEVAAKGNQR